MMSFRIYEHGVLWFIKGKWRDTTIHGRDQVCFDKSRLTLLSTIAKAKEPNFMEIQFTSQVIPSIWFLRDFYFYLPCCMVCDI